MISLILIKCPELRGFVHIHPQLPSRSSDEISVLKPAFSKRLKHFCPKFWVRIILGGKKTWDVILEKKIGPYLKLLMARNVKKSPKGDGSVGRVQGRWSQVQSKYNLSFGSTVYHSPACLCFSGPDPAQLKSKKCFVFDVNRSRSIFNLPAAVP